jgi:hypothetical protein
MITIKPTPTNNLSSQPYIVNEFDPIIIKKDKMYTWLQDWRLIFSLIWNIIKENNFKCIYVDNKKKHYDFGTQSNLNNCVNSRSE